MKELEGEDEIRDSLLYSTARLIVYGILHYFT